VEQEAARDWTTEDLAVVPSVAKTLCMIGVHVRQKVVLNGWDRAPVVDRERSMRNSIACTHRVLLARYLQ